jgi:hypothetical protein
MAYPPIPGKNQGEFLTKACLVFTGKVKYAICIENYGLPKLAAIGKARGEEAV